MIKVITGYIQESVMDYILTNVNDYYCIEFPEDGRHPKYSCKLVDGIVKNNKNVIIATLSECIVNRIGYLIYKGMIDEAEFIQIDEDGSINSGEYSEEGFAKGWKLGFFIPDRIIKEGMV